MHKLYLYSVWVRVWHWTNALLFLILIFTGLSMHFAGGALLLPFQTAVPVHNAAGIALTISWIAFIVGNLVSDNKRFYRVPLRGLIGAIYRQARWYMIGIFRREPHPFHPSADDKMNLLQKLTYLGVMLGLMPVLVISGWAFLFSVYLPETLFGLGSVWLVAMIHLAVAWMLVLFLITHLYMITTGDTPTSNIRSMLTGWHRETDASAPTASETQS